MSLVDKLSSCSSTFCGYHSKVKKRHTYRKHARLSSAARPSKQKTASSRIDETEIERALQQRVPHVLHLLQTMQSRRKTLYAAHCAYQTNWRRHLCCACSTSLRRIILETVFMEKGCSLHLRVFLGARCKCPETHTHTHTRAHTHKKQCELQIHASP